MNELLAEIKAIPGVIGGGVYSPERGLLASNLPPVFKKERVENIARSLIKLHTAGTYSYPDLLDVTLYYEESVLQIREVGKKLYLVLVGDPALNTSLLSLSINLALEESKGLDAAAAPAAEAGRGRGAGAGARALIDSGPLAEPLGRMQQALAKVIGPMAKIIFGDALEEWGGEEEPSLQGLSRLLTLLNREIGDPEKVRDFRDRVAPILKGAGAIQ